MYHLECCKFNKINTTSIIKICIFLKAKRKYIQKILAIYFIHSNVIYT